MMEAAMALKAVGSLVKGVAGYQTGRYNAKVAKNQAVEERALGNDEERRIRVEARRTMGLQIAAQAESGFQVGTGSALTALEESLINREVDILTSRRNAIGRQRGLQSQAMLAKRGANMALFEGVIGAAGAVADYKADYGRAQAAGNG